MIGMFRFPGYDFSEKNKHENRLKLLTYFLHSPQNSKNAFCVVKQITQK